MDTYNGKITMADPDLIDNYAMPGDLHAWFVYDRDAESNFNPDSFGYHASVEYNPRRGVWMAPHLSGSGAVPPGLVEALERWSWSKDRTKIERYMRIFHDVAELVVTHGPNRGDGDLVGATTHAELARENMTGNPNVREYLIADLATYCDWATGNVYGVIVNDPVTGSQASLWGCFDPTNGYPYLREVATDLAAELQAATGAAKDNDDDDYGDVEAGA